MLLQLCNLFEKICTLERRCVYISIKGGSFVFLEEKVMNVGGFCKQNNFAFFFMVNLKHSNTGNVATISVATWIYFAIKR